MDAGIRRLITAVTAGFLFSSLILQPAEGQAPTSINDDLVIILDASASTPAYTIRVKPVKLEGLTMSEFEIHVAAEDSVRRVIEFQALI